MEYLVLRLRRSNGWGEGEKIVVNYLQSVRTDEKWKYWKWKTKKCVILFTINQSLHLKSPFHRHHPLINSLNNKNCLQACHREKAPTVPPNCSPCMIDCGQYCCVGVSLLRLLLCFALSEEVWCKSTSEKFTNENGSTRPLLVDVAWGLRDVKCSSLF